MCYHTVNISQVNSSLIINMNVKFTYCFLRRVNLSFYVGLLFIKSWLLMPQWSKKKRDRNRQRDVDIEFKFHNVYCIYDRVAIADYVAFLLHCILSAVLLLHLHSQFKAILLIIFGNLTYGNSIILCAHVQCPEQRVRNIFWTKANYK